MKAKSNIPRVLEPLHAAPQTEPPDSQNSKADELASANQLIDTLLECLEKNVMLLNNLVGGSLPTLLFIQSALNDGHIPEGLFVRLKGENVKYCAPTDAVGDLLSQISSRLYEGWNEVDGVHFDITAKVEAHKKLYAKAPAES